MPKRKRSTLDKADDIAEAGNLLLGVICGFAVACPLAAGVWSLVASLSTLLAIVLAVIAWIIGFVLGLLAYHFRWFLRSLFD